MSDVVDFIFLIIVIALVPSFFLASLKTKKYEFELKDKVCLQGKPITGISELSYFLDKGYKIVKVGQDSYLEFSHNKAFIPIHILDQLRKDPIY